MSARQLYAFIWLFPLVFLIHDGEELLVIERWTLDNEQLLKSSLSFIGYESPLWTTPRFVVAVAILLALICWACWGATRPGAGAGGRRWVVIALAVLFLNVFTHTAQSIWIGGYTPGVITAIAVALPYTLYMGRRLLAAGWLRPIAAQGLLTAAVLLLLAGLAGRLIL